MNTAELDDLLRRVTVLRDSDAHDALVGELKHRAPRPNALLHPTAIVHRVARSRWALALPSQSRLLARADGLLAVLDTTGLVADPRHGAAQVTILDAATAAPRATWLPAHGVTSARFDGGTLIVQDADQASAVEPLSGRVLGPAPRTLAQEAEHLAQTPDTVWVTAGADLVILDRLSGRELTRLTASRLDGPHTGYDPTDGLVLVDTDDGLSAY